MKICGGECHNKGRAYDLTGEDKFADYWISSSEFENNHKNVQ